MTELAEVGGTGTKPTETELTVLKPEPNTVTLHGLLDEYTPEVGLKLVMVGLEVEVFDVQPSMNVGSRTRARVQRVKEAPCSFRDKVGRWLIIAGFSSGRMERMDGMV